MSRGFVDESYSNSLPSVESTFQRRTEGGQGTSGTGGSSGGSDLITSTGCSSGDYLQAALSGVFKVAADKVYMDKSLTGDWLSKGNLTKGLLQSILSYFAGKIADKVRDKFPEQTVGLEVYVKPVLVGGMFSLITKYIYKTEDTGKVMQMFITSSLSDLAASGITPTVRELAFPNKKRN